MKQVNFETLRSKGADSSVVVRLMMACNDLSFANMAFKETRSADHSYPDETTARAAGMYFLRIEMGHLWESLKIIQSAKDSPVLMNRISKLDSRSQASFAKLAKYLPGGEKRKRPESLIGTLRNNLGFHYHESGKWIDWAISDRASRENARNSSIVRSSDGHRWRFHVADDVVDSIVIRKIWKIPRERNTDDEVGKIGDEVNEVLSNFLDFCGEFIWDYCSVGGRLT